MRGLSRKQWSRVLRLTAAVLLVSELRAQEAARPPAAHAFTIVGVLVRDDGTPIAGDTLHCFLWLGEQAVAPLGTQGDRIVTASPRARTDGRGRFVIKVDSAFVARYHGMTTRYALGFVRRGEPTPLGPSGVPVVFDLELARQSSYRVDLGRLVFAAR